MYRGGSDQLLFKQIFCQFQGPAPLDSRGRPRLSRAGSGQLGAPPTVQRPSQKVLKTQFNSKKGAKKKLQITNRRPAVSRALLDPGGLVDSWGRPGLSRGNFSLIFLDFWKIQKSIKIMEKFPLDSPGRPQLFRRLPGSRGALDRNSVREMEFLQITALALDSANMGLKCCFFLNLPRLRARADRACDRLWQEMEKTWAQMGGTVPVATLHKEPSWRSEQCVL